MYEIERTSVICLYEKTSDYTMHAIYFINYNIITDLYIYIFFLI